MPNLIPATLLFLLRADGDKVTHVCLTMKKRGFAKGKWNGAGGKSQPGETPEACIIREAEEELSIKVTHEDLEKKAVLEFRFPANVGWPGQEVHVFFARHWQGEPQESEEVRPEWFSVNELPYAQMWADDPLWLPRLLKGEKLQGKFEFGDHENIINYSLDLLL